jgi:hypothetical protein
MSHNISNYGAHNLSMLALPKKQPKENKTTYIKSSKVSKKWLQICEKKMNCKIQMADDQTGTGEFSIMGPNKHLIYFDGYDAVNRVVFEFHGCKYHECKICFKDQQTGKYEKTIEREKYIISKGYRLFHIWECQYHKYIDGKTLSIGEFITY